MFCVVLHAVTSADKGTIMHLQRSVTVAVRFAYVPLNGSPDPGTSRASLVRLRRLCSQ
jgi:hypothetical protein